MLCNTTSFDAGIPTARHPNDPVCQTGKTPRLTDGRRSALGRGVGARQAEGSRNLSSLNSSAFLHSPLPPLCRIYVMTCIRSAWNILELCLFSCAL